MADSQTERSVFLRIYEWLKSAAGITIMLCIVVAILATIDKGAYVLVNTMVIGGMWALMATGLALGFSVMNVPNFAYGEFFMIGTLVAYFIITPLNSYLGQHPSAFLSVVGPLFAIFGATCAGGLAGAVVEKLVFHELRKRNRKQWFMNCFLLTVGLQIMFINAHQLIFGTDFKGIVRYWNVPAIQLAGVYISIERIFTFLLAIITMIIFWLFLKYSKIGKAIRAVSEDEEGALSVGINFNGIQTLTMALSCALAALAGATLLYMFPSTPTVGVVPLYYAWFVVILIGMGNIAGATAGGFIVALLEVLTRVYAGEGLEFVIPAGVMILILIIIPSGIFGAKVKTIWDQ
jgi:branched-chain amino acid transport system permease protein